MRSISSVEKPPSRQSSTTVASVPAATSCAAAAVLGFSTRSASGRFSSSQTALWASPCLCEYTVLTCVRSVPGSPMRVWRMGRTTSPTTETPSVARSASA